MTIQPLYSIAQGTSDSNGDVTLTFQQIPQSLTWTGSISVAVNQLPVPTGTQNPFGIGNSAPLRLISATWTIILNGYPYASFQGLQMLTDFQATGRQSVNILGYGLPPNTPVIATWSGYSGDTSEVVPITPSITGSSADPASMVAGPDIFSTGSNVAIFGGLGTGAGSTVPLAISNPNNSGLVYLMQYSLGISLNQLSTTTGTRSCTAQLAHGANIPIAEIQVGSVPASVSNETTDANFTDTPLFLGTVATANLNLITGTTGADAVKTWVNGIVVVI